jgi:membrane protease YdiL (CAAX protease family)
MKRFATYAGILLLDLTGVLLIGAQWKPWGWVVLGAGALVLGLADRRAQKDLGLVYGSIALLGLTPIDTNISYTHMLVMGGLLGLAVGIPYTVSRFVFKDWAVRFQWHHGRRWYNTEIAYIGLTLVATYLLFPFMLHSSGSYLNWTVDPGVSNIARLFIGTNALGIWDELFFICTVFSLLRRHVPVAAANLAQAVLFTSFLYELGFRGWAAAVIFCFALLQGFVFMKTESLLYVITIHLTADFVLFLALIALHHPGWMPIFIT